MLLSMTGFGKAVVDLPNKKFIVEIKSLNSKQLDLSTRVPQSMREHEMEIRNTVAKKLERGKVELNLFIESHQGESAIQLNLPQLAEYKKQFLKMQQELELPEPSDWYSLLLRFPDSVKSESITQSSEEDHLAAIKAVDQAADALMQFRRTEGEKLESFFATRVNNIANLLLQIPQFEMERVSHIRSRIVDSLTNLPHVEYDRGRLEQEMIFYIEKLDINEEKQRLRQHINYFLETMNAAPGQGKKLGFISQEMGREINTLGSKSNHAEMQKIVVKMKDELEQIKEQVLNVM